MANNQYVNKVVYNNSSLIDLTEDTVTPESLLNGYTAHNRSGAPIRGSAVIPTKVSELENDAGYVSNTEVNGITILKSNFLGNYLNTTANSWEYTGLNIVVPVDHIYAGVLLSSWTSGKPIGIGVNKNTTSLLGGILDQYCENENGVYSVSLFLLPGTWYVFTKRNNAASSPNPYTFYYVDLSQLS